MAWFWKNREDAEAAGDLMYNPGPTEAIRGFLANHDGSASRAGILTYLAEMYGTDEFTARGALWRMTQSGELAHEGDSYQVPDEPIAPDGLSDWG